MASRTVGAVTIDDTVLKTLISTTPGKVELLLDTMAFDGERDVKQSFSTQSPSSPGNPPGVVTGALRASIHTERTDRFTRAIVAGTEYALPLELGSSKMAARPYMMPMAMRLHARQSDYWRDLIG